MNNKEHAYQGFETWFNSFQMKVKMHLHIIAIFFAVQVALTMVLSWFLIGGAYTAGGKYILNCIGRFQFPDMALLSQVGGFIFRKSFWFFIIASFVWIFYPAVVRRFTTRAKKQAAPEYIRGSRIAEDKEIKKVKGDLPFGSFNLPKTEEIKHVFAIGRPGTGKTVFLSGIVERLKERGEKVIVYDFKGDYTSRFYDPSTDMIFNPLDKRSAGWNLFDDVNTVLDINSVAQSLVPPVYSGETFFNDAARAVFGGILFYLYKHNLRTNKDIWQAVTAPGKDIHAWLSSIPEGARGLRFVEDHSSKQALGVFSTMMQYTSAFEYMSNNNGLSINEWLRNGKGGFIFVTNQSDLKDTLKPILSLFVDYFGKKLLSMTDDINRRVFFILDEFGTLQRLSTIKDLLIASRSKGGSCWLGIQDIGQINKLYTSDVADTIVNACGTSLMFAVSDPKTAKYLSDKIGETEYREAENTLSYGVGDNRDGESLRKTKKTEALVLKSQFMNLPDLTAFAKIPNVEAVLKTKFDYRHYPALATAFEIRDDLILEQLLLKQAAVVEDADYYQYSTRAKKDVEAEKAKDDYPGCEEEINF
ncbi:MAG TPA: type IV secretion system DNA-binding domain-containing protein [Bacilli bacterium]|nr:type IV secretion system DNA-binding domain-containing protein [Bacilli bacterium]